MRIDSTEHRTIYLPDENSILNKKNKSQNSIHMFQQQNVHFQVNISSEGHNAYYKKALFDSKDINQITLIDFEKANLDEVDWDNYFERESIDTIKTLKGYGEKYAKTYDDIKNNYSEDEQKKYIDALNKAYDTAIQQLGEKTGNRIDHFLNKTYFKGDEIEQVTFDKANFNTFFSQVGEGIKNFYVDHYNEECISDNDLTNYLNQSVKFEKGDITHFSDLSLVLEVVDTADAIIEKMEKMKNVIVGIDPDKAPKEMIDKLKNQNGKLNKLVEDFDMLVERIEESDLSKKMKKSLKAAVGRASEYNYNVSQKMTKYQELLEKYKELMDRIKQLEARSKQFDQKADEYNEQDNLDFTVKNLERADKVRTEIASLQAKAEQIKSQMGQISKEIQEPTRENE